MATPPADIENAGVSGGSAPSQSGGAPEISEEQVGGRYYIPLLQATFKGDWESAKRFLERDSASKTAKITSRSETVLHIAALSAQDQFFENLVELLSPDREALEMVDCDGRTALHIAVLCGRMRMVKALVRSNPKLTQLADDKQCVPLGISARDAPMHKEIIWFLAKSTTGDGPSNPLSSPSAIDIIMDLTYAGHHDITLYIVGQYPPLLTMRSTYYSNRSILDVLASLESHFLSGTRFSSLEALIYKCILVDLNYKPANENLDPALQCITRSLWSTTKIEVPIIKRMYEVKLRYITAVELAKQVCIAISKMETIEITKFIHEDLLFQVTSKGISELVKLFIQFFPELKCTSPYNRKLVIEAVNFRQERTLSLFLKMSSSNELSIIPAPTWPETNQMMLRAAEYNPYFRPVANLSGAAFQLQRELQWFKAVESWLVTSVKTVHYEGKSYWNIFVEEHKMLLEKGEKWVKDTANSCMLISTLIATVLFAAIFTVPGANDDKTGVPLLLGQDSFLIFTISDALGLLSSMTAILLFLAILTSRDEAEDFLESLPKKIIMGLCLLFLSLAFMLVAFAATLTIVLDNRLEWILIPITLLASIPAALFVVLQLPLLYQMVKSTYGPSIFHAKDIWK